MRRLRQALRSGDRDLDPLILGGVTLLLTAVAAVACLAPASRAGVDRSD
jgi:hypothetical protein